MFNVSNIEAIVRERGKIAVVKLLCRYPRLTPILYAKFLRLTQTRT